MLRQLLRDMRPALQAPAAKQTPKWGDSAGNPQNNSNTDGKSDSGSSGAEKPAAKESAAPKTWRGVGEWQVGASSCPTMCFSAYHQRLHQILWRKLLFSHIAVHRAALRMTPIPNASALTARDHWSAPT